MIDSLRYWVTEMGVDGFRFDLVSTLIETNGTMLIRITRSSRRSVKIRC